jgi:hypothetical protein
MSYTFGTNYLLDTDTNEDRRARVKASAGKRRWGMRVASREGPVEKEYAVGGSTKEGDACQRKQQQLHT